MASEEKSTTVTTEGESAPKALSCPAFLSKLWLLVDDENTDGYIHWSEDGKSFIVADQVTFASEVLPYFFKHNNFASFNRQLNKYGFRKRSNFFDHGALKSDLKNTEFQHPHFLKGKLSQLQLIKRRTANTGDTKLKPTEVGKILPDVQEMKRKQDNITSDLDAMIRGTKRHSLVELAEEKHRLTLQHMQAEHELRMDVLALQKLTEEKKLEAAMSPEQASPQKHQSREDRMVELAEEKHRLTLHYMQIEHELRMDVIALQKLTEEKKLEAPMTSCQKD